MKLKLLLISAFAALSIVSFAQSKLITSSVNSAQEQTQLMLNQLDAKDKIVSPRTTDKEGKVTRYVPLEEWTSGFFPGSLWYLYELSGDEKWRTSAVKYTEGMERIKHFTGNHDIGFMIFCSFGNGLRLTDKESYKDVIVTAANSLTKRYRADAGVIQSWNKRGNWECPVIIDNMMNLELLFEATQISGDSSFWKIAVSHADQTIKHHYRPDMSSYHVVDYNPATGAVRGKCTAQGYADESAWSRGQAWGLYGYVTCYRYTKDARYLQQAQKIANYIFNHPNLPKDLIPYWDFDAPKPSEGKYSERLAGRVDNPRDVSAASITASALYELSTYVRGGKKYKKLADKIVKSLASETYMANKDENGNFLLKHSTGSIPHNVEIDLPLVYADYYFLESLKRKRDLETK